MWHASWNTISSRSASRLALRIGSSSSTSTAARTKNAVRVRESSPESSRAARSASSTGCASISSKSEMCGTSRHASAMLRAIARRIPRSGSRRSPPTGTGAATVAVPTGSVIDVGAGPAAPAARTSAAVTRPLGPLPATAARSTPSSRASLRTGGAACTTPAEAVGCAVDCVTGLRQRAVGRGRFGRGNARAPRRARAGAGWRRPRARRRPRHRAG